MNNLTINSEDRTTLTLPSEYSERIASFSRVKGVGATTLYVRVQRHADDEGVWVALEPEQVAALTAHLNGELDDMLVDPEPREGHGTLLVDGSGNVIVDHWVYNGYVDRWYCSSPGRIHLYIPDETDAPSAYEGFDEGAALIIEDHGIAPTGPVWTPGDVVSFSNGRTTFVLVRNDGDTWDKYIDGALVKPSNWDDEGVTRLVAGDGMSYRDAQILVQQVR